MRCSVRENDPGYRVGADGMAIRYHVTLNGKHIPDCFTADEELGEACCLVRGEDGRVIADFDEWWTPDARPTVLKEVIHRGEVKITPKS